MKNANRAYSEIIRDLVDKEGEIHLDQKWTGLLLKLIRDLEALNEEKDKTISKMILMFDESKERMK